MSDKISYVLEVLDGYSAITKNLKKELSEIQELTKFKFNSSDFKGLAEFAKQADKIATSAERLKKAKTGFTLIGEGFSSPKINAAALRANRAYEKSLKNALVPYNSPFVMYGGGSSSVSPNAAALRAKMAYERSLKNALVPVNTGFTMMGGGRSGGSYNPRRYKPNFTIPIDSTYRRGAAGTGIVPYSRGGAVMSYGQRPMIDVTGTGRIIEQDTGASFNRNRTTSPNRKAYAGAFSPIKFNPYTGRYEEVVRKEPKQPKLPKELSQPQQPSSFGGGGGASFTNVAKATGYYRAIDMAVSVPSKIHDVTIQMDGLRAGLAALIPTVKGMKGATSEGEVNYLRGVADKYGADFTTIAPSYLKLLGTGGSSDAPLIKGLLENVSGYAGILNLDTPAFERTMLGFQDMLSKQVLNAQEVNLQMANLPGAKPMFHKAYKRYAEKRGVKGITDENASIYFTQAMATGKLSSVDVLREFVEVMNEMFGEDMIKKSFTLGREEKRLKNAFQELGDQIGLLTYDTQIGAVRGLTSFVKSVGSFTSGITGFANDIMIIKNALFPEKKPEQKVENFKDKFTKTYGQTVFDLGKLTTYGAAKYTGALITAGAIATRTGDTNPLKEYIDFVGEDFDKNYFRDKSGKNIFANDLSTIGGFMGINNEPQKIEITIKSDNNIQVKDVKSNRPSTVKAGQK
jgi:hypothetical protein